MISQTRPLQLCNRFLTGCAVILGPMYFLKGEIALALSILLLVALVVIPCKLLLTPNNIAFFSKFVVVAANFIICFTQTISKNITLSVPLMIVAGSLSALFFDPTMVRLGFLCSGVFFTAEYIAISLLNGGLAVPFVTYIEFMVCIITCFLIVHSSIKSGVNYLIEAHEKQEETECLLKDLDQKNAQTAELLQRQHQLLMEIQRISDELSNQSKALADQSEHLAHGSSEQASAMENLTDSMERITDEIRQTEEQAQQVRLSSETMRQQADIGNVKMKEMLDAIAELQTSISSIGKITKTVSDIALQTNLLALNASVEAARAGAAGKGFSVVADEVRTLANNSAETVSSAEQVLVDCQNAMSHSVQVANHTADALNQIIVSVDDVAQLSSHISKMTNDQMGQVESMNQELGLLSGVIQSTAAAAEETSSTAQGLSLQAKNLHTMSEGRLECA